MTVRADPPSAWQAVTAVLRRQLSVGVGIIAARIFGFATGAIVARGLGPDGFGRYTVAFTIFSSLLQLTSFADTWLVSRWGEPRDRPAVLAAVRWVKLEAALLLTAGFILFAALALLTGAFDGRSLLPALVAVVTAAAGGLTTALAGVGQAEQRFGLYTAAVAGPPLIALGASSLFAVMGERSPTTFVVALFVGYAPLALRALGVLGPTAEAPPREMRADILAFGGWVTVGTVFYAVFQRIDLFLLGTVRPVGEVGLYGAAVRLSAVGALGASIMGAALMPIGSRAATWNDSAQRRAYVRESAIAIAGVGICLTAAVMAAPQLISRIFGSAYADAVPAARVLLLGQILLGMQLPFYFALYALSGRRWIAGISLAQLVAACVGGALFVRPFGMLGAAWSNALTYAVGAGGVAVYLLRRARRFGLQG